MSKKSSEGLSQVATLVDLLRFRADHQPQRTAYDFFADGETQTASLDYQTLEQSVQAVATLLQSLGSRGKPVLLLYPPGIEYIVAFLGCSYAGAIAVPAYPPRPNRSLERLQIMIQDAGAAIALTHSDVLQGLERRFQDSPFLKKLHWLATDALDTALANNWQDPDVSAHDLALLQYTSGSTGKPKGVMVSHGNLIDNSAKIYHFFGHSEASRGMSWLPPYHDMGLVGGILQPLYAGMPIALMPPVAFLQKPFRWLQIVSQYGATTSGGPNFAYDLCIQKTTPEQRTSLDLSRWQVAFSGAEPVRAETIKNFTEAFEVAGFQRQAFYPCYGMAETTLIVTGGSPQQMPHVYAVKASGLQQGQAIPASDEAGQTLVSCGEPAADQPLLIVDPETCKICSEGQVGEIWIGSSGSVTQGYWQQAEQTTNTFQAFTQDAQGPFLRTGDLGFLQGGELFVTGRRKELIIIRGRNYYPKDIETTVEMAHEALQHGAGAAFSVMIEGQERLAVVQEVKRTYLRRLNGDEILGPVRRAIAEQHDLQLSGLQLIKTGGIPKTSSGKIQRFQCRADYLSHQLPEVYAWEAETVSSGEPELDSSAVLIGTNLETAPETDPRLNADSLETEITATAQTPAEVQQLLTVWMARELNLPTNDIDIHRPFAEYGLDSVAAVELTDVLQTAINQPLSPTLAYEYPTIEAVAQYLGTQFEHHDDSTAREAQPVADEDDLTALMNELEDLSEADVEKLLEQQER